MESNGCGKKPTDIQSKQEAVDKDVDGGWAWVVFAGLLFNTIIYFGQMTCGPIYFVIFLNEFQGSQSYTAWILAAQSAAFCAAGPLASYLLTKIGPRPLMMIGGILYSLCFALCYMANSIPFLILIFSMSGMSCSFTHQGNISAITIYFRKKAYKMLALMFGGAGIGGFIFGLEVEWAVEQYGWRGAMLIQAALVSHICIGGSLVFNQTSSKHQKSLSSTQYDEAKTSNFKTLINFMSDVRLWLIVISMLMMNMTLSTILALLKNIVIDYGFEDSFKYVMAAYSVGGTFGRGGVGLIANKLCPPIAAFISSFVGGIVCFLFLFACQPWIMCSVVLGFGLFLGANSVVILYQMGWVYGPQKMAVISGYTFIFCIITTFCGAPVAGYTVDVTGNYNIAIIMSSVSSIVGAVSSILLYIIHRRRLSELTNNVITVS
ncbi:hypothetical protein CHUAL_013783 [Chamberlinius hualienensis]